MRPGFAFNQSAITAVGTPVTVVTPGYLSLHEVGVEFFSDAVGTPATASAGTVAFVKRTLASPAVDESLGTAMDATAPVSDVVTGFVKSVKAMPSGIGTATHYRLNVASGG